MGRDPTDIRLARAWVAIALERDLGMTSRQDLDTAMLAVSELVTNVLLHTSSHPVVTLRESRREVIIEVGDDDPTLPVPRRSRPGEPPASGLRLVGLMVSDWGSRPIPGGKIVWFSMPKPPAADPEPPSPGPETTKARHSAGPSEWS